MKSAYWFLQILYESRDLNYFSYSSLTFVQNEFAIVFFYLFDSFLDRKRKPTELRNKFVNLLIRKLVPVKYFSKSSYRENKCEVLTGEVSTELCEGQRDGLLRVEIEFDASRLAGTKITALFFGRVCTERPHPKIFV
jgi:hypothetical protein